MLELKKDVKKLSSKELHEELINADKTIAYYRAIKEEVIERMLNKGENFDGFKLKARSSKREISDTHLLLQKAKDFNIKVEDLYKISMLSPSKISKKFKRNKKFLEFFNSIVLDGNITYYLIKEKKGNN